MTDIDGEAFADDAPRTDGSLHRFFRERFGNPSAVYGLIVYTAALGAISLNEDDLSEIILEGVLSLLIFFVAHLFAHTLADHGRLPLGRATLNGVRHSAGMLYSAIPSTAVLVAGAFAGWSADDAVDGALLAAIGMLGILGYSSCALRGASHPVRWVGAICTATLGLVLLILNFLTH